VLFAVVCTGLLLRSRVFSDLGIEYERLGLILSVSLYNAATVWLFYIALEPYVRRFWPQLLIGWTRLISGRMRDPLVGREVLVGVAAGTIGAFLIESRQLVPHVLHLRPAMTDLIGTLMLLGSRHVIAVALQTVRRALGSAIQIVGIVVLLKIIVKRTWLVLLLGTVVMLPTAMNGTFAGEELALELSISAIGVAMALAVLLRFGFLAEVVMFYTFMLIEAFPLTANFSRPYASVSMGLIATVAALSVFGFVASRGDEPLFGRAILD
jgi:serine/threonine-protein kinase